MIGYKTGLGECWCMDSRQALRNFDNNSIDLILTSPPFGLNRKKQYTNCEELNQDNIVNWLLEFFEIAYDKIKDTGSIVIDLGGSYKSKQSFRSLYQYEFILRMCNELHYNFVQDIYWYNSSALPSPIQYVNIEHSRLKSAVNLELWFSKGKPKADNRNVLVPYSDKMKSFLKDKNSVIETEQVYRPSGHIINKKSWKDNGGAIPSNLLQIPNSDSNSDYIRVCRDLCIEPHPARFPIQLCNFFILLTTEKNDVVVDIYSGSNVTGKSAENLGRRWFSYDISPEYVSTSSFRFNSNGYNVELNYQQYNNILNGKQCIVGVSP